MKKNNLAPVAVFVYKRLDFLKILISSLKNNYLSKKSVIFIFSDGWKNEYDKENVLSVRKYIANICSLTSQKNQFTGESIRIEPIEGNIILFPSYLPHSVETNNHDDERISISFNVIALPKGSIEYLHQK